jgi:NADPH:quinone reductase-like Zn-dependent oxidoreductase
MRVFAMTGRGAAPAVVELDAPEPGPGEVRVAIGAASINGFDLAVAGGLVWDHMPHTFPVILGRDYAGTVDALGDGVSGVAVGDRVAGVNTALELGAGPIAEQFVMSADALTPVPATVSDTQAAALGLAGITALDAIAALNLSSEDSVLVVGATGGVGSFAVQLAAAAGARVIATARPGEATEFVRRLGAADVVDHTGDLANAVRAVAPGGPSAVLHAAGDPAIPAGLLAPGSRFASVLGAGAEQIDRDDLAASSVLAVYTPSKLAELLAEVAAGELTVPVTAAYPLTEAPEALAAFGRGKRGKIAVTTR